MLYTFRNDLQAKCLGKRNNGLHDLCIVFIYHHVTNKSTIYFKIAKWQGL